MNDHLVSNIKTLLVPKKELNKKQVALFLTQEKIEELDQAVKSLSVYSNGKVNRNILIEMAIDDLLESIPKVIKEYEDDNSNVEEVNYDSILVPSNTSGIDFIKKNKFWEYVKLDSEKIRYLKYIVFYINAPFSQIMYYAEIKSFEQCFVDNQKKYRVYLKSPLIALDKPVVLGDLSSVYARSIRYTTLDKVKNAKEYKDLI